METTLLSEKAQNSPLSVEDIVKNGEQWNKEWIQTAGSKHWLNQCWKHVHRQSSLFVSTSCETTAEMIRWKSGLGTEWSLVENDHSFEEIEKKSSIFQVAMGEEWTNNEHILTIWNGHVIQSYYGKFTIESMKLTEEFKKAVNNLSDLKNYEILTRSQKYPDGIPFKQPETYKKTLKVFYWLPVGGRAPHNPPSGDSPL